MDMSLGNGGNPVHNIFCSGIYCYFFQKMQITMSTASEPVRYAQQPIASRIRPK
jgi:hypothetical protein